MKVFIFSNIYGKYLMVDSVEADLTILCDPIWMQDLQLNYNLIFNVGCAVRTEHKEVQT